MCRKYRRRKKLWGNQFGRFYTSLGRKKGEGIRVWQKMETSTWISQLVREESALDELEMRTEEPK